MSEEQKRLIEETVENLKHLDKESLLVVKGSVEVLKARDASSKYDDALVKPAAIQIKNRRQSSICGRIG